MWIVIAIVVIFLLVRASRSRAGSGNAVDADAWHSKRGGERAEPPIDVDSELFQTSAMKAREFLAETTAARGSFVDNHQVEEWKDRYAPAFVALRRCAGTQQDRDLCMASEVFGDLRQSVDQWNSEFIVSESARCDALFGRLDAKQREACVSDEVATLVVAGAGSGKTSTIQKKVEYLIRVKGVAPSDILLLSFTNKAADEMTERLAQSMPQVGMTASTFHKFGLGIVKSHRSGSYDVAPAHLCSDVVLRALSPDSMTDDECRGALRFFAACANPEPEDNNKFKTFGDYIEATRSADFRTLRGMTDARAGDKMTFAGECVKSFEELEIANWLYLNGITYEYERKYDGAVSADGGRVRRVYKPDFYLPAYNIWIEHFGVDKDGNPPPFFSKAERDEYLDGMKWKRNLHKNNGTVLVESYSWWHYEGKLIDNLWDALKVHGVKRRGINPRPVWSRLLASKTNTTMREFARLVASFISMAKSRGIGPEDLESILDRSKTSKSFFRRAKMFFEVVRPLYRRYIKTLESENAIDFHDMINMAADFARGDSGSVHQYKYVIIDEFQDISVSREGLILAVVKATGAKLFCVGDDWQSIYRFAGSDISLFTDFTGHFGFAKIVKLENTYRNSQELLSVAGQFIMKNPRQIKKELKSASHYERPVSCVFYKEKEDIGKALCLALEEIAVDTSGEEATVMLIGRHNQESEWVVGIDDITSDRSRSNFVWSKHSELKLSFLTVHKAKGLEADYVILLNFRDDMLGFPNMIADDPLLELLLSEREQIPFAEERRVFYVALTRARRRVLILAPEKGASVFLRDLPESARVNNCDDIQNAAACPKCKKGRLVLRMGASAFYGCTNYPRCDYTLPMQKVPINAKTPRCSCGGFLVPCNNHQNGHGFLGCTEYPRLRSIRHDQRPLPKATQRNT